jgi:hypothetical protein
MEDYSDLISRCRRSEEEAVIKGTAMGAIILSRMGPVYEKGAIRKFQNLAIKFSKDLKNVVTADDFETFHARFIEAVHDGIRKQDGGHLSYGEAQKSVNVFLKTYIDRSSLPDAESANRIRPFLHVPLDSVMIKYFRKNFRSDYDMYIGPAHDKENADFKSKNTQFTGKLSDAMLSELKNIFQDVYFAWQKWFRAIYSEKPILLDTIWSLERERE